MKKRVMKANEKLAFFFVSVVLSFLLLHEQCQMKNSSKTQRKKKKSFCFHSVFLVCRCSFRLLFCCFLLFFPVKKAINLTICHFALFFWRKRYEFMRFVYYSMIRFSFHSIFRFVASFVMLMKFNRCRGGLHFIHRRHKNENKGKKRSTQRFLPMWNTKYTIEKQWNDFALSALQLNFDYKIVLFAHFLFFDFK